MEEHEKLIAQKEIKLRTDLEKPLQELAEHINTDARAKDWAEKAQQEIDKINIVIQESLNSNTGT